MCGRYDNLIAAEAYRRLFGAKRLPHSNFPPRYNVAPTDQIAIVRLGRDDERELVLARWGLVPFWTKEMPKAPHINARAETVDSKPMFREAFAKRRCLVPATGFFEWQQRASGKQPYRITRKDLEPFAFAGLWEFARIGGEDIVSAAIIAWDANDLVAPLHDRMPVILEPATMTPGSIPPHQPTKPRRFSSPSRPSCCRPILSAGSSAARRMTRQSALSRSPTVGLVP